jgi:putative addiction module CopG family antidote
MQVSLASHQKRFMEKKIKGEGYLSRDEVIREALRVYELAEEEDYDVDLAEALRKSLRSPPRKHSKNHFL